MCSSGSLRWLWQLDRKAFLFSCSLRPELCSNQCKSSEQQEKNILWATGLDFSTSQADLFVFPTPPSHPFAPTKLTVPVPKYLYSYITSKYTLATFKPLVLRQHLVSYLEEEWECLFCTLLSTELSPGSPQRCTSSHNPKQSTKQVHEF